MIAAVYAWMLKKHTLFSHAVTNACVQLVRLSVKPVQFAGHLWLDRWRSLDVNGAFSTHLFFKKYYKLYIQNCLILLYLSKTMTFIYETFDNFEKLVTYIANEDKFAKGQYNFTQLVKLEQIVRKLQKRIYSWNTCKLNLNQKYSPK